MLTLAFHTVPESYLRSQCNPSELLCVSCENLFPGPNEFVLHDFFLCK